MNFKNFAMMTVLAISLTQASMVKATVGEFLSDVAHGTHDVASDVVHGTRDVADDVVYGTDGYYVNEPEYVSSGYGYRRYPYRRYEAID